MPQKRQPTPSPARMLFAAILGDDRAAVKALLKGNPNLAATAQETEAQCDGVIAHWIYVGDTALHIAAAGYRVEIAKLLLTDGADVNSCQNHRGATPLHYASDGSLENPNWNPARQVSMIRLFLEAGANLHAQDKNGATPLHRAVRTRCAAAVECLLDAGGDATMLNKPGSTAFHLAVQNTGRGGSGSESARNAQREIIRSFLKRGISPALEDQGGKSVLEWARSDSIRELLGARPA
jgi:ankyrin repeat protein